MEDESRLAQLNNVEILYPFLNERLIGAIINFDPMKIDIKYLKSRYLISETFKDYIPNYLYDFPDKYRGNLISDKNENHYEKLFNHIHISMKDWHPHTKNLLNLDVLKNLVDKPLRNSETHNTSLLNTLALFDQINYWVSRLD